MADRREPSLTVEEPFSPLAPGATPEPTPGKGPRADRRWQFALVSNASSALVVTTFALLVCGLAWNYTTHRYLTGFADAIVPLEGSPQEKTEALLKWFRHVPERINGPAAESAILRDRDPVKIVQNARLLKICGSATNAFINVGDVAGLRTRRLLLLGPSGGAMHVVAEVQWGEQWVVVDPQQGRVFRDHIGRPLTKEELRDREVFRDAISGMPGSSRTYTFERTAHLHLERLPLLGALLHRALDRAWPEWEEAADWGYFPENPSLWLVLVSLPLLLLGILIRLIAEKHRATKHSMTQNPTLATQNSSVTAWD